LERNRIAGRPGNEEKKKERVCGCKPEVFTKKLTGHDHLNYREKSGENGIERKVGGKQTKGKKGKNV